jgi:hypothetical protein
MDKVVDELGLVLEGEYLTVFIPATTKAFVFRIKARTNKKYETLNYGPLPLSAGTTLPTFDGGSVSVPANGVIPARAYTKDGITFPLTGAYDSTDMWYVPEDYRERLFHVIQYVTPAFLRMDVQIPVKVTQGRFQKDKIMTGVETDFGFSRGMYETVHIPKLHYGYRYANDTNVNLYTFVKFIYAEYIVEIPKNATLIFDILSKRIPSHWLSLPINYMDKSIEISLMEAYGITGFTLYRIDERDKAIKEYDALLKEVKI